MASLQALERAEAARDQEVHDHDDDRDEGEGRCEGGKDQKVLSSRARYGESSI